MGEGDQAVTEDGDRDGFYIEVAERGDRKRESVECRVEAKVWVSSVIVFS